MNNKRNRKIASSTLCLLVALIITSFGVSSAENSARNEVAGEAPTGDSSSRSILLTADRLFDGEVLHTGVGVLIKDGKIKAVGAPGSLRRKHQKWIDLGDATILPGFIELHSHIALLDIPRRTVLEHGITTARDVGGPLFPPTGGTGSLRLLSSGPILTNPGGYPLAAGFADAAVATEVTSEAEAREKVRDLVAGGAVAIKIGLDQGGEVGAPWSEPGHGTPAPTPWPLMPLPVLQAIVDEAHDHGRNVIAHVGEAAGVERSLDGGVDEWSHIPCDPVPPALLQRAVTDGIKIVGTLDTLSRCTGVFANAFTLRGFGATFLYGAEIAHTDIPWGIDAEELHLMVHVEGKTPTEVIRAVTSQAGAQLGLAPLGTLSPGAPADVIAVPGNPLDHFKPLEYPALVISGGQIVVNRR